MSSCQTSKRWADICDCEDETECQCDGFVPEFCCSAVALPSKAEFEPSKAELKPTAAMEASSSVVVDVPNFYFQDEDVWDCDVEELKGGKQIVCINDHTYELGSLTNDKKRALTTDELKTGWTIKAIEVCPESATLSQEESAKVFQGLGAMRVKAASEAFKCKLSLRGFGAEGQVDENGIWVPHPDNAPPVALIAAKNDKPENLARAIDWVKARVCQIHEGIEDEFEAKIKNAWAAVEASRCESGEPDERLKEAKKEQSNLQKAYVKHLKAQ